MKVDRTFGPGEEDPAVAANLAKWKTHADECVRMLVQDPEYVVRRTYLALQGKIITITDHRCPRCDSTDVRVLASKGNQWCTCKTCGHIWTVWAPTQSAK